MSYNKLDDRTGTTSSSMTIGYHQDDVILSDGHLLSSASTSEQHDSRTSLSEPLTKTIINDNGHDLNHRIYDNNSSSSNNTDPFYVFREDLYQQLSLVDETLAEFLRVVYQTVRILSVVALQ
jgi:hypothetical protein